MKRASLAVVVLASLWTVSPAPAANHAATDAKVAKPASMKGKKLPPSPCRGAACTRKPKVLPPSPCKDVACRVQ